MTRVRSLVSAQPAPASAWAVQHFTTDGIAAHERHTAWIEEGCPFFSGLLDSNPDGAFDATVDSLMLGPLFLSYGSYGAQSVRRDRTMLRRQPVDYLYVGLSGTMASNSPLYQAQPGSLTLVDIGQEFQHVSSSGGLISIAIPRALAFEHGLDPARLHGATLGPRQAALVRAHLVAVRDNLELIPADQGPRLAATTLDLLAVAVASEGLPAVASRHAVGTATKLRAERIIAAAIEHPGLDADYLCGALRVSRSALYRLFEADGGLDHRIRHARLLAARDALREPGSRIGDIAARFGFCDTSHFSRAFRAEFATSPTDCRAAARMPADGSNAA